MGGPGHNVIVHAPAKSAGLAAFLTFLFGPLGMLYSTVLGAFVMFVLYVVVGVPTLGLGLIVLHPLAIIWAALAAHGYNQRVYARATASAQSGGSRRQAPASPSASYRECPHCKERMRRDAGTCPHCRKESPAWTFHEGYWWITTDSGDRYWLDHRSNEWKLFEAP